jgi:hypothetical protein
MKRFFSLALVASTLLSSTSCNILDTKPSDFVDPAGYYNTQTQLNNALASVYDNLGKNPFYASVYPTVFVNSTDESYFNTSSGNSIPGYNATSADANVANLWGQLYAGIDRANLLLANMDRATGVSDADRRHIRGEAMFLRAYYYFILTQWWGDVPLKTTPTASSADGQIAFTPSKDVYDFVISEMTTAEGLLNDQLASSFAFNERITQTVVQGILARVCLYEAGAPLNQTARYAEALAWAKKVQASGLHQLHPDFTQVFKNMSADAYDNTYRESMWEIGFYYNASNSSLREASQANIGIAAANGSTAAATFGQVVPLEYATGILYKAYQSTVTFTGTPPTPATDVSPDLRRDWTVAPISYTNGTSAGVETPVGPVKIWNRFVGKWRRQYEPLPRQATDTGRNWPVLRYSDVLLMLAEAENEVNGPTTTAYDALNQVRRRGYGLLLNPAPVPAPPAASAVNLSGLTQATFRQAIRDERLRELAFEGFRRQDLKRWNLLVPTVTSTYQTALNGSTDLLPNGVQRIPALTGNTAIGTNTTAAVLAPYSFMAANIDPNDVLLPIPTVEITNNRLAKQNPGY